MKKDRMRENGREFKSGAAAYKREIDDEAIMEKQTSKLLAYIAEQPEG